MKNLIPAPIDEKNITSDWIDCIFDSCDRIVGGKHSDIYTGFVADLPTNCFINGNAVLWHIDKFHCGVFQLKDAYNELLKRLKALDDVDDESTGIVVKYDTSMKEELILMQQFFFKEE